MLNEDWADEVHKFWFEELTPKQWFNSSVELDDAIKQRFGELHAAFTKEVPTSVRNSVKETLAAIIVLDQFSRNLCRGTAEAFCNDEQALALSQAAIAAGDDKRLSDDEKTFLYMPFMHAENMQMQDVSVELFESIGRSEHAIEHRKIVAAHGRYPHRNGVLSRESTEEELAYLQEAKRFGQ